MQNTLFDSLDKKIRLLAKDDRTPISSLAKRLKVTAPTLCKRIKNLEKEGLLKFSGRRISSQIKKGGK